MRPARHLLLVAGLATLLAACGGSATPEPSLPTGESTPSTNPTLTPSQSATPPASVEPTDAPSVAISPDPTELPSQTADVESQVPGSADACTGTDANREFFVAATRALEWTVYCAVLPSGWFVDAGEYRQASGGRLEISYRGPSGARLELRQGGFCADTDGCVPAGSGAGEAVFGDMNGALVGLDEGGWAVVVDRGAAISWLAVVTGLDETAARALAEGLIPVDG
jgi:hypothetical protein